MSTYVIGDVHGQMEKLRTMLKGINPSESDRIIFIGDVIDRGPDGWEILKMIKSTSNMEMITGNHENLMVKFIMSRFTGTSKKIIMELERCWDMNGGSPTYAGFLNDITDPKGLSRSFEVIEWVRDLPTEMYLEVNGQKFHLVHGFPAEKSYDRLWDRPTLDSENPDPDSTLIVGHTPIFSLHASTCEAAQAYLRGIVEGGGHLKIEHAPGFIDIDCGAAYDVDGTRLAAIRLDDMSEFYV